MKKLLTILFYISVCISSNLVAQETETILSPDRNQKVTIRRNTSGEITYQLSYKGQPVIQTSKLGFQLAKPSIQLEKFKWETAEQTTVLEEWEPVWGEQRKIQNHYTQAIIQLETEQSAVKVQLIFRVFNDGVGFRYAFPTQKNLKHFIVKEENTEFNQVANHTAFWIPGDYDTNEYLYNTTPLSEINAFEAAKKEKDIALQSLIGENTVQTPLMMKTKNGLYINIHEAALVNYPVMHLDLNKNNYSF